MPWKRGSKLNRATRQANQAARELHTNEAIDTLLDRRSRSRSPITPPRSGTTITPTASGAGKTAGAEPSSSSVEVSLESRESVVNRSFLNAAKAAGVKLVSRSSGAGNTAGFGDPTELRRNGASPAPRASAESAERRVKSRKHHKHQ
jgi:hypothetical protein